jgi:rubrerythrin
MSVAFNADEVFEMAEQIERNGARFYREVAAKAPDRQIKDMFLRFAAMEDTHLRTFQEMRKSLSDREKEETTFDPEGEAVLYLQDGRQPRFRGQEEPHREADR